MSTESQADTAIAEGETHAEQHESQNGHVEDVEALDLAREEYEAEIDAEALETASLEETTDVDPIQNLGSDADHVDNDGSQQDASATDPAKPERSKPNLIPFPVQVAISKVLESDGLGGAIKQFPQYKEGQLRRIARNLGIDVLDEFATKQVEQFAKIISEMTSPSLAMRFLRTELKRLTSE